MVLAYAEFMARFFRYLYVAFFVALPLCLLGQVKEWQDLSGNRVRGEIVSRDDDSITLRLDDGGTLVIPMDNLSPGDRRIAFAWRPRHGNPKAVLGRPWTAKTLGMELVWIPPGSFRIGSSVLEKGRGEDEPQREVVISRGFWLSKFEVTQAQWLIVMRGSPSEFEGDDLPVEHVTWNEATSFCQKMTKRERDNETLPNGYIYSLPSEAQWEYACRAGTRTAFGHGNEAGGLEKYGWTIDNAEEKTHEIGKLLPNPWGLHDMHGNVLEWCRDVYGDYPKGKSTNPTGAVFGDKRVARGGSILNSQLDCRSAKRYKGEPAEKDLVGLRVVLTQRWR